MNTEDTNIKSTCAENVTPLVLPMPPAKVIAEMVGVSESYAKKVIEGVRADKSKKAQQVKYCHELIIEGQQVLLTAVSQTMDKLKNQPSDK